MKLHAEDFADRLGDGASASYLEALADRVNEDILEEFQPINIGGAFPGVTIRKMAEEADLKPLYNLRYQPLSAEAHGQWDSLVASDLARSRDPLYDGHRFGTFSTADERLDETVPLEAMALGLDTVARIFEALGVDIDDETQQCWDAASAAHEAFRGPTAE